MSAPLRDSWRRRQTKGVLQRIAINAAAGISSIDQVTRLSVLNTSADSLGVNQRRDPAPVGSLACPPTGSAGIVHSALAPMSAPSQRTEPPDS